MKQISVHLPFATIENCRDLGGIQTKDGSFIRPGMLLRSADLARADRQDLLTLQNMHLSDVIDLRTPQERLVAPDRLPQGAQLHEVPVCREHDLAREEHGQIRMLEEAVTSMHDFFLKLYQAMILDADSQKAWKQFFEILADSEGMTLWHCTQGKDRTGMAAALLLHLLDVDEQTIFEEYMQTNLYMTQSETRDRLVSQLLSGRLRHLAQQDIDAALFASPDYYEEADRLICDRWGSWKNYLQKAVGIDSRLEQKIRQKVLCR